ncbi:MAG: addiction module protein [Chthoniobacteraceae bacterium]|jgi:putative addiction module component (TIGR02574 family)
MTLNRIPEIQRLSKQEKLQLVGDLWDEIATMPDDMPVSQEEAQLLDQRWKSYMDSPEKALTLEDFKKRMSERL